MQDTRESNSLASSLPDATHILRGSLLQRPLRFSPPAIPAVALARSVLRKEQVAHVKRCLANYQELKAAIEKICEINQHLLRAEPDEKEGKHGK